MSTIADRLRAVIVRALDLKIEPPALVGQDLITELGITSVDALEILIWVENEFGVHIDDNDLSRELVSSITRLEDYITARSGAPAQ